MELRAIDPPKVEEVLMRLAKAASKTGKRILRQSFRRRSLLSLVLVTVLVGVITSTAAGTKRADTQIVIDTSYDQLTADPARNASNNGRYILRSVYDALTTFKPKLIHGKLQYPRHAKPNPWLALSYSVDKTGKTWTFRLRRNVVFSDGTPLTADDVVFSLLRTKNVKGTPAFFTQDFASVKAVNKYTVTITTTQRDPAVPYLLVHVPVVNSTVAKQHGATDAPDASTKDTAQSYFDTHSLGSGPYIYQTFSTSSDTVLVKNPRFWGKKPYFDRIVFRNVTPETARLDLISGQADFARSLTSQQVQGLPKSIKVYRAPSETIYYLQANFKKSVSKLAANPHLWNAIRYGLDYKHELQIAGKGAIQACGLIPRQFNGSLPASACVHRNIAKAKAELKKTGVKNPTLTLEYPTSFTLEGVSFETLSQAVQAELKQIGLKVKLKGAPLSAWLPRWAAADPEMTQGALAAAYPHENSTSIYFPSGFRGQYAGFKKTSLPDIEKLGERAMQTINDKKRAALYQQLQRKFNTETPLFPQFQCVTVLAASSKIKGVLIQSNFGFDPTLLHR
jgi:peptide/nickel transport system substrate-binding protein